ncbi:hypothetical protein C7974DRAFT_51494 [Boeremia exigua]|uniref:uncharacterized protein n=1 Tax=Boeremia exigua TaxID=749465 RepID=UPI001E8D99E8|nr:uncharacterized protein C7974DRAFT_51494 [Boeremia exigua]KAH6616751.1 hypothetical protein C7974DRAFT_51494 [Boeremia exigua]
MDPSDPGKAHALDVNNASHLTNASANTTTSATPQQPTPPSSNAPAWSVQMNKFPSNGNAGPSFHQFSASTAAILERLQQGKSGHASTSAAFEAKKAEIMQNYATSDKLSTPPPAPTVSKRVRGGKAGTPLKTEVGATPAGATPMSGRGSAKGKVRGRGRARGGRGGRGGKRKRSDSAEEESDNDDDDDSDVSETYTPQPTRTKSGRSVNRPIAFVPVIPEPTPGVKRRKSTKTMLAAKCKTCQRDTDPSQNRIVFCDSCSTAYHQYCHNPPISNEVVTVLEKEWLCGPCARSRESVVQGTEHLVAAEDLSIDEKRAYLSTLPQPQLVSLLLHATIRHPELPVFPPNIADHLPNPSTASQSQPPAITAAIPPIVSTATPLVHTPNTTASSSEAQVLREMGMRAQPRVTLDMAGNRYEEDDGYDTDPPTHYPKAGQGLARTLRPESEDLQWLVDDNFEVFSHGWKGDGSGLGADGTLDSKA